MKTTKYFKFRKQQIDRIEIKDEWIRRVLNNPHYTLEQQDGRVVGLTIEHIKEQSGKMDFSYETIAA